MKEETQQFGLNIAIVIFSVAFAVMMLADTYDAEEDATGLLPNIVAVASLLFCLAILFAQFVSWKSAGTRTAPTTSENAGESAFEAGEGLQWWWSYLAMLGYFALILLIGLLWATLAYVLIVPYLMNYTNWKVIILTSAAGMISLYATFYFILRMNMPAGILF